MAETLIESSRLAEPAAVQLLRAQHPDAVLDVVEFRGETTVRVPNEPINALCRLLRDDSTTQFNFLVDLTAVDQTPRVPRFDVVYLLYSLPLNHYVRLKAAVAEDGAIESVADIWAAANWAERECYDMFGIQFANHPDLRRILLPDYWDEGFPLRKEYPLRGYRQNKWDYAPVRTTQ
jgi:NADH-quinone oxidoreductase subunit C